MKKLILIALFSISTLAYSSDSATLANKRMAHKAAWKATAATLVVVLISEPKSFVRYLGWGFFGLGVAGIIMTSGRE